MIFEIKISEGKGLGMFATRDIAVGELVASEAPSVIATPFNCHSAVAKLTDDEKKQFLAFSDIHTPDSPTPTGVFRTNALPLGQGSIVGGIFPNICRVNQSCSPNVHHSWNAELGHETLYAIVPILAGGEVLTSYLDTGASRSGRQKTLRAQFCFDCTCSACSGPLDAASDIRRARIAELDEIIGSVGGRNFILGYMYAKERVRLLDAEGLADQGDKGRSHYDAFQMCVVCLDFAGAKRQAGLAFGNSMIAEGKNSESTVKFKKYWRIPQSHRNAAVGRRKTVPMCCDGCGSIGRSICKGCACAVYCDADCAKEHEKWHGPVCKAIQDASTI